GGIEQARAHNVEALLAAASSQVDSLCKRSIRLDRKNLPTLAIPLVRKNIRQHVVSHPDAFHSPGKRGRIAIRSHYSALSWRINHNLRTFQSRRGRHRGRIRPFINFDRMASDRIPRADAKTVPASEIGSYGSLHLLRVLANAAIEDDIVKRTVAHRGSISGKSRLRPITKVKRIDHLPLAQRRREVISKHGVVDQNAIRGYQMAVKVGNRRFHVGPENKSINPPRVSHPTKSSRQTANHHRCRNRI